MVLQGTTEHGCVQIDIGSTQPCHVQPVDIAQAFTTQTIAAYRYDCPCVRGSSDVQRVHNIDSLPTGRIAQVLHEAQIAARFAYSSIVHKRPVAQLQVFA